MGEKTKKRKKRVFFPNFKKPVFLKLYNAPVEILQSLKTKKWLAAKSRKPYLCNDICRPVSTLA